MPNWITTDITDQAGGFQPAKGQVNPCAFATGGLTQYLAFRGQDNHIHAIWNSIHPALSNWQILDVSKLSGFPEAVTPLTDPKGLWGVKNSIHLFFVGSDNHIYNIYSDSYAGITWKWTDLTSAGLGPLVAKTVDPVWTLGVYLWPKQNTQHVVYVGVDNNIHRLSHDGQSPDGQWSDQNVSAAVAGGLPPQAVLHPSGFAWQSQATEHIFYRGITDNHIHELYSSNGQQWSRNDLNKTSANQAATALGPPECYMFDQQGTEHVVYVGSLPNDTLKPFELYFDNGWNSSNLYASANLTVSQIHDYPPSGLEQRVSGYLFQYEETQHVVFPAGGHIIELCWNGSWNLNDLTASTGAPPPGSSTWLSLATGFAWQDPFGNGSQNFAAVVYVGDDGHIYELSYLSNSPAAG